MIAMRVFQLSLPLCLLLVTAGMARSHSATTDLMAHHVLIRQLGTLSMTARSEYGHEQVGKCTLEFSVLAQEWTPKGLVLINVNGSFGVIKVDGDTRAFLNVDLYDIESSNLAKTPSPLTEAYFISDDSYANATRGVVLPTSTASGGVNVIFRLDPAYENIATGLMNEKVMIGAKRLQRGTMLEIEIDTGVVQATTDGNRRRSRDTVSEFFSCAHGLMR